MTHTKDEAFSTERALKLALDALGKARSRIVEAGGSGWKLEAQRCVNAITAIKQALERMAENARELGLMPLRGGDYEPVQQSRSDVEPVAWVVEDEHGERLEWAGDAHSCHGLPTLPLYTTPPAQPASEEDMKVYRAIADNYRKDLAAAQRPWFELTDEEIKTVIAKIDPNEHYLPNALRQLSLAIEAKLKEKNSD